MVLLYSLTSDVNSEIQLAFPAKNTGFFNKLRKVLTTRSAIEGPLSVKRE